MPTRTPRIPDAALAKIPGKALYRMATAGAEVVIGGDHASLVLPEARASKWGGECWLRVRHADADDIDRADKEAKARGKALKAAEKASLRAEKGKPVLDIPTTGKGRRHEIREGSLKWDVVYDSPAALPADGIERFQLEFPEGLTWHYQPALTAEEIAEGHERPEEMVGGYVAYWAQCGRYLDGSGGEVANYETGRFGDIKAPLWVDAAGKALRWTQELVGSELRCYLPTEWLATAVYPVRLDPTFGFDSFGASVFAVYSTRAYAFSVPQPEFGGTVSKITIGATYLGSNYGSKGKAAVYAKGSPVSGSTLLGQTPEWTAAVTGGTSQAWHDLPYTSGPEIAASTDYLLGLFLTDASPTLTGYLKYDSASNPNYYAVENYDTDPNFPNPYGSGYATTPGYMSIYATYEESGGANTQVATSPGTLGLSGPAPSSAFSGAVTSAPGGGALTITPQAAEILFSGAVASQSQPGPLSLVPQAPQTTLSGAITSAPESGLLDLTGHPSQSAFSGAITSATLPGSLAFSGLAGQIIVSGAAAVTVLTTAGALGLAGEAPSAAFSGTVTAQTLPGLLALAGVAPGLLHSGAVTVELLAGELSIDGQAVETTIGGGIRVETAAGLLSLLGEAPSVVISGGVRVETQPGSMALTGAAPVMIHAGLIEIVTAAGGLSIAGLPVTVSAGERLGPIFAPGLHSITVQRAVLSVTPVRGLRRFDGH